MNGIIVILLSFLLWTGPGEISKINTAKAEAKKAFNDGKYAEAVKKYRYLVDKLGVTEDEVMLNLAHAYYLSKDTTNARAGYLGLTQSSKNIIRSKALQQLGLMNNKQGKSEEALQNFKQAIKADPSNEDARYNYEMLKKKLDEKKKQEQNKDQNKDQQNKDDQKKEQDKKDQDQKNKDQQNKDQKNQDKKDQDKKDQDKKDQDQKNQQDKKDQQQKDQDKKSQEQKDQERKEQEKKEQEKNGDQSKKDQTKNGQKSISPEIQKKLDELNWSKEKMDMILDAMKNEEMQYLQQNKRKATKPKDKGKPDW